MNDAHKPCPDEVEELLLNARLRDELEPFFDESITRLEAAAMPTPLENKYLASILAWERAPVLPISRWFDPELQLPDPLELSDARLHQLLWETVGRLYEKRIVLSYTDHFTDRELFTLIYRDILPEPVKKLDDLDHYLRWDCADIECDAEIWLRYYADEQQREEWAFETGMPLPPAEPPPFPRKLPQEPQ